MPNAAVLWTGGKDSSMALYEARQDGYRVSCLVTFAPPERRFLAHPLCVAEMQAQALGLPLHVLPIAPPFEKSYEIALSKLRDEMGIDAVVTGDIAEVGGNTNWIRERSRRVGMTVHTPLWGRDRNSLLRTLLERGFRARFSCVDTALIGETWIGRELNDSAIGELQVICGRTGLDMCGEDGEYHTLVIDGPQFSQGIDIRRYSTRAAGSLAYMEIEELRFSAGTRSATADSCGIGGRRRS